MHLPEVVAVAGRCFQPLVGFQPLEVLQGVAAQHQQSARVRLVMQVVAVAVFA